MDVTEIKKLMTILNTTDVTEISLEADGTKVLMKKDPAAAIASPAMEVAVELEEEVTEVSDIKPLISLNVGHFSIKGLKVGDEIKEGQVIGAIEAIGIKTEVKSDKSGIIKEILVENGEGVEFSQPLMMIKIK